MRFFIIIILCIPFIFGSCSREDNLDYSFYYWKSKASYSETISEALAKTNTQKIYLHYFDVDNVKEETVFDDGLYPSYVLKEVDEEFKNYDIIPVVFIANNALKKANIKILSSHVNSLIDEISLHHFNKKHKHIQLDCDWTQTTRSNYFLLIELLKKHYFVSVTIRLHQIKFKRETGVPPVKKGVLMVYNVGKLDDEKQNSILESNIVASYINHTSTYPFELDVALPLFSQTVLISKNNQVKLVNGTERKAIEESDKYFRLIDNNLFEVLKDTLYKGFYLSEGYKLKLEEVSEDEIISSYNEIKKSKLDISGIIFYHLDETSLLNTNLNKIVNRL